MTATTTESRAGPSGYDSAFLDVSVRSEEPSAWMIEVRGELDLATGPILKQHLESYSDPNRNGDHPHRIVYQLSNLEFMDVTGLRSLLDAVEGHSSETITIRDPSPRVRRLLELVDMGSMIEQPATR